MKQLPILVTDHDSAGGSFVYTDDKHANAVLQVEDNRTITRDQQKKVYAMLGEIDEWTGNYTPDMTKAQMKYEYMLKREDYQSFSLSDCSIKQAGDFIDFLISFCFSNRVPFASYTLDLVQGSYGWEMYALENKQCCICRNLAEVAHVHSVGMGRDRQHIRHIGNSVMALCHTCHMEQHRIGIKSFMYKHHLKGVRVTPEIAKMLRLGNWHVEDGEPINSTREESFKHDHAI